MENFNYVIKQSYNLVQVFQTDIKTLKSWLFLIYFILKRLLKLILKTIIKLFKMSNTIRIPNIQNYNLEIVNSVLILTPKISYIDEKNLEEIDLSGSKIIKCTVNENNIIISNKLKYMTILVDIYKKMPIQKILQNTNLNMSLQDQNGINGYNWREELKLSIQGVDSNKAMRELIKMLKLNNYSLDMDIQLKDGKEIKIKL